MLFKTNLLQKILFALSIIILIQSQSNASSLEMMTSKGKVIIELDETNAPQHAKRLIELSQKGFYDNIIFHRVIDGFMAQTGDPTGTGMGGSDLPDLNAEFSDANFKRGTVGMARSSNPNSANSQFFIMFDDGPWLDGQYTVIGTVTEGMDVIDRINKGQPPANPDKITSMRPIN